MVRATRAVFGCAGLAASRRDARAIETETGAIRHHLAQAFTDGLQRGRLDRHLGATGWLGPIQPLVRQVRGHEPSTVGKHRVSPGQLQWGDLHHRLTDRCTGHVFWNPGR